MGNIKYYMERYGPYIFSAIIIAFMYSFGMQFVDSKNLNNALDSINTIAALIIGFLGAILPVVLGMKNESKFVKYVFEKDENKLFLKYIKSTIIIGLVLVFVTLFMYFLDIIVEPLYKQILFYLWLYLIVLFLLCTYRCLANMLTLIFSEDSFLESDRYKTLAKKKGKEELEFEKRNHISKQENDKNNEHLP